MSGKDDASVVSDYVDIMDKSLQYTEQDYIQCVESKDWEGEAPSWCLGASQASELGIPCMGPLSLPWGSWLKLGCVPRIRARDPVHGAPPVFLLANIMEYIKDRIKILGKRAPSWCLGASQASELGIPCMGPLSLPWGSWLTLGCVPRIRARGPVHGAPPVFLLVANWLYICGLHLETAAGMSVVGLADGGKEESRIVVTCWFVYWHSNAGKILHNSEDEAVHRPQGGPVKM